jgi:monofunctional biosynthetic peptidoglycan transglycosylase
MVHVQRRVESWFTKGRYQKRHTAVPLSRISPHLHHAVIAAEDSRFYMHHGIDFEEMREAYQDSAEEGQPMRGASTLTQQLVKNLFFTTHRNPLRKAAEYPLTLLVELCLSKQRILELYLNVVEWGPGVYGAEAAAWYHYNLPASRLNRDQAVRLAAILPNPRRRRPARMNQYSAIIQERMALMGW